jgi:hypothetical protein
MKQNKFEETANNSTKIILDLEKKLETVLKPVTPRTEFVYELKQNLYNPDYKRKYLESAEWMLLIAASFFSIFILLFIGIRSVVMLISALGIIRQYARNKTNIVKL